MRPLLPVKFDDDACLIDSNGNYVDGQLIVAAVNYHHRLREALEKMMRQAYTANGHYPSDDNETFVANEIEIDQARALLTELNNLEPKP